MTPEQIELVQNSWKKVEPISVMAAELFYSKLFELNPDYKNLFKEDMTKQGRKLMDMINMVVNSLAYPEAILPAIKSSGKRHAHYGVEDSDYDVVGEAFIWTLRIGLGNDFTDEVKQAWIEAYTFLSKTMKDAAATIAA